jgi:hypothetical protein
MRDIPESDIPLLALVGGRRICFAGKSCGIGIIRTSTETGLVGGGEYHAIIAKIEK